MNYLVTLIGHSGKTTLPWRVRATSRPDAEALAHVKYFEATGKDAQGVHSVIEPKVISGPADTPKAKSHKAKGGGKSKKK